MSVGYILSSPLVSVIIPTFNRAHSLNKAIDSVLSQTYKDFELIIIDDGSTDDTSQILKAYQDISIFKTENNGVSKARNIGIQKAKGKWISFLDSDDVWLKDKLMKQVDFAKQNPSINLIHGEEIWIRNGKRVNPKFKHQKGGGDQFIPSLKLCAISPSTVMLKKELLMKMGLFREDYPCCEDYDLWLKITSQNDVGFIDDFLIEKYGGHKDQLSQKYKAMDYWRVKSIDWVLNNIELNTDKKQAALDGLFNKCKILIKGYEKHGNTNEHYREVKSIFGYHFS